MRPVAHRFCLSLAVGLACTAGARLADAQVGGSGGIQTIPDTSRPARPPASGGDQPATGGLIDLRPRFRAGQSIRYVYEQTARNSVRSPEKDDETLNTDSELSQRLGLVMRTVRADDTGTTIELEYESVRVKYKTDAEEGAFDSAARQTPSPGAAPATKPGAPAKPAPEAPQPPADPLAALDLNAMLEAMFRPMVGSRVTVELDRTGAIRSVSGGSAPGGGLGAGGAGIPGLGAGGSGLAPDPRQIASWLVQGASGSNGLVRVGQSWTNADSVGNTPVGPMRMQTRHTLRSANLGLAQVAFVGAVEGAGTDAGGPMGVQLRDAAYSGTYQWDTRDGALAGMQADMRVDMQGGATLLNLRMNSETQVRVSRVTPAGLPQRD